MFSRRHVGTAVVESQTVTSGGRGRVSDGGPGIEAQSQQLAGGPVDSFWPRSECDRTAFETGPGSHQR